MKIQEYIQNLLAGKSQVKTENQSVKKMKKIMGKLGNPQNKLTCIHITGTNGKGSVVEMLNSILMKSGLKVGKFISPHLVKYNERICVNNEQIKDEEIEEIINQLEPIVKESQKQITFFEFTTIAAILYFYKKQVDIVLMEVGIRRLI